MSNYRTIEVGAQDYPEVEALIRTEHDACYSIIEAIEACDVTGIVAFRIRREISQELQDAGIPYVQSLDAEGGDCEELKSFDGQTVDWHESIEREPSITVGIKSDQELEEGIARARAFQRRLDAFYSWCKERANP